LRDFFLHNTPSVVIQVRFVLFNPRVFSFSHALFREEYLLTL